MRRGMGINYLNDFRFEDGGFVPMAIGIEDLKIDPDGYRD